MTDTHKEEEEVLKSYLFVWRVSVEGLGPEIADDYVRSFARSMPKERLSDLLNADVEVLVLPVQEKITTSFEVVEFNINSNTPYTRFTKEGDLEDFMNTIREIKKEKNNV